MQPVEANLRKVLVPEMLATDIAEYLGTLDCYKYGNTYCMSYLFV
jgi:hypothetical protein